MENVKWMSILAGGLGLGCVLSALFDGPGGTDYVIATGLAGIIAALLALGDR